MQTQPHSSSTERARQEGSNAAPRSLSPTPTAEEPQADEETGRLLEHAPKAETGCPFLEADHSPEPLAPNWFLVVLFHICPPGMADRRKNPTPLWLNRRKYSDKVPLHGTQSLLQKTRSITLSQIYVTVGFFLHLSPLTSY